MMCIARVVEMRLNVSRVWFRKVRMVISLIHFVRRKAKTKRRRWTMWGRMSCIALRFMLRFMWFRVWFLTKYTVVYYL